MDEYEIKSYKNRAEVEVSDFPDDYLNGIIEICKSEIASRKRMERVFKRMVDGK